MTWDEYCQSEMYIIDCFRGDIDLLESVTILKDGREFVGDEILAFMEAHPEFDLRSEMAGVRIIRYDKVFDGVNRITVDDIRNLVKLGMLKDDMHFFEGEDKKA